MIFINLLPDIKLEYVRSLRFKRLLVLLSAVLITCCIIIVSVLFFVANIQQPRQIANIEGTQNKDKSYEPADSNGALIAEIKQDESIQEILTIQRQLQSLSSLRQDRFIVERLFALGDGTDRENDGYLDKMAPPNLTNVNFDFTTNTFSIAGKAESSDEAIKLHRSFRFVGFKDCTEENKSTRIYPFRVGRDVLIAPGAGEDELISYVIEGKFSSKLFENGFPEADLNLKIPDENVAGHEIGQPKHPCGVPPTGTDRIDPERSPANEGQKDS